MVLTASRHCCSVLSSANVNSTSMSEYGNKSLRPYPPRASKAAFGGGISAKARRHISMRIRSTTADRRRIAAVPSPVRSHVWRTSAISRRYCSRRSSTAKATGVISSCTWLAEAKGCSTSISQVAQNVNVSLPDRKTVLAQAEGLAPAKFPQSVTCVLSLAAFQEDRAVYSLKMERPQ